MKRRTDFFTPFIAACVAFGLTLAAALAAVGGLNHVLARTARGRLAGRPWTAQPLPPEPRLQIDPEADLKAVEQGWAERLNGYAWVDRRRGLARIPIDRAMQIMLRRGFPVERSPR